MFDQVAPLGPQAFCVAFLLASQARGKPKAPLHASSRPMVHALAEILGITPRTVRKTVRQLVEAEVIRPVGRHPDGQWPAYEFPAMKGL